VTHAVLEQAYLELPAARVVDLRRKRSASDGSAARLEDRLRRGVSVDPDPKRPGFYECEVDGVRYYFHAFRSCIYLLGSW